MQDTMPPISNEGWKYLVDLRQKLIDAIRGISNSKSYLAWDDTTPNSTTRHHLQALLKSSISEAAHFGVYVVTRHLECGRRNHSKLADAHGYIWTEPYGLNITWADPRFRWKGHQLYQGDYHDLCPCVTRGQGGDHRIIQDIISRTDSCPILSETIMTALSGIYAAAQHAGDKQPRSGIRENLLREIIRLNNAILPQSVDDYILARQAAPSQTAAR